MVRPRGRRPRVGPRPGPPTGRSCCCRTASRSAGTPGATSNWALTAAWHGGPITPPALFLAGEQDLVVAGIGADALAATLRRTAADLREARLLRALDAAGNPAEVSGALIAFATDPDRCSPT
ncbi:MAG: hypothetical protein L0K86_22730 [Actinomycetia bacterium]|nr:hypothetical protein [Actinomycetes bacterium]